MTAPRPLSSFAAVLAIARLSTRRLTRTKSLWIALALACAPVAAATLLKQAGEPNEWDELFALLTAVLAVIAPLCITSSVSEEIEDRTFTFLWSRPIPRWAILAGKVAGIFPILALIMLASFALMFLTYRGSFSTDPEIFIRGCTGVLTGALLTSTAAAAFGVLIPKHAVGAGVFLLLAIDIPVGAIPFSLANLSVTYHMRAIAKVSVEPESLLSAALWSLALIALWGGIGIWRVTRGELSVEK
jgi:ABC-type transport system involved in multi-copper enzyme maturation permease subunit